MCPIEFKKKKTQTSDTCKQYTIHTKAQRI
jgi:hypothetical protein